MKNIVEETKEKFKTEKPENDIDLSESIKLMLIEDNFPDNYIDKFVSMAEYVKDKHSDIQKTWLSSFLSTEIALIGNNINKDTMGLRFVVLMDYEKDQWLEMIRTQVLPFLKEHLNVSG